MPLNVAQKLITAHLVDGSLRAGTPITLKIDQTLTQDATGTLVMLTLEALRLDRVRRIAALAIAWHSAGAHRLAGQLTADENSRANSMSWLK